LGLDTGWQVGRCRTLHIVGTGTPEGYCVGDNIRDHGDGSELVGILKEVGVVVRNGSKAGCLRWVADWKELEELDEAGEGGKRRGGKRPPVM